MRLAKARIKNFKSINEIEIHIPRRDVERQGSADFVSIVGENNAGKSSILDAILLALPGGPKPTLHHFPELNEQNGPIEVEFEFNELTEKDKEEHAIRAHFYTENNEEKYRIKKTWRSPNSPPEYFAYDPEAVSYEFIDGWPNLSKQELRKLGPEWIALIEAAEKISPGHRKPIEKTYLAAAASINSNLIRKTDPDPWVSNPGGNQSNLDTILPNAIHIPALRETESETNVSDKKSTIRKIVNTLFDHQLANHERVIRFKKAATELERLFQEAEKHDVILNVESRISEKLKHLINISASLKFTAPDVTSDLASKTEFWIRDGSVSTKPENQGHGAQRSIVLALLQMYAEQAREVANSHDRPTIFLIEEPEIYLHPEMCRKMRDALLGIAQSGIAQVICTTHSPVFLDLADRHDGIVIIKKKNGHPQAKQRMSDVFSQSSNKKNERARLRMLLDFDPAANEVFFTDSVCLVEGDCEVAAIDAIARRLVRDGKIDWSSYLLARRSTSLVNCRGKWTIAAFQQVLKEFDLPHRVIHDADEEGSDEGANKRIRSFLQSKKDILIHDPNFERHIFNEKWPSDKPWKAVARINALTSIASDSEIVKFLEFALGKSLADLARPSRDATLFPIARVPIPPNQRKNLRHELKPVAPSDIISLHAQGISQLVKLAAGPNRTPDSSSIDTQDIAHPGTKKFVRVTGDSMANTLIDGDIIELEPLNSLFLNPVNDEIGKIPIQEITRHIQDGGIYVVAKNDQIDQCLYTIKRIRIRPTGGDGWFAQIRADNPETEWGNGGREDITKDDRVHFAFKVIGLVSQSPIDIPVISHESKVDEP